MSEYPRVTQILSDLGIRSAGYEFMKPKHRRRGRLVHEACHILGKGMEIDEAWFLRSSGEGEHDQVAHSDCIPYIDGYRKFMRDNPIRGFFPLPRHRTEVEVISETERYVGHMDQVGVEDQILDIKTGKSADWARLQTALYATAYRDSKSYRHGAIYRYVLELSGDGDYRLIHHDDFRDLAQAIILVRAWHTIRQYGGE